jgi:hypothetical protein
MPKTKQEVRAEALKNLAKGRKIRAEKLRKAKKPKKARK